MSQSMAEPEARRDASLQAAGGYTICYSKEAYGRYAGRRAWKTDRTQNIIIESKHRRTPASSTHTKRLSAHANVVD